MAAMGRDDLLAFLGQNGIAASTTDHPALHTVAQSQGVAASIPGAHTKNLFLKDKKGAIFLVVALHETQVDLKQLHKRVGASGRLSFASAEAMQALLGVTPGSVTAFGVVNDTGHAVQVVLDERLGGHDMVNCHPLTNTATTTLATDDLMRFFALTGHAPMTVNLVGVPDETSVNGTTAA